MPTTGSNRPIQASTHSITHLALIALLLAACPAKDQPPPRPAAKHEATPPAPPSLSASGDDPEKNSDSPIATLKIDTDAENTVTAAGKPVTTRKDSYFVAPFDLEPALLDADPRFLTDLNVKAPLVDVEVTATAPDHGVATITAHIQPSIEARNAMARRLAAASTRPLSWAAAYQPGHPPAIQIDTGTCAGTDEKYADHDVYPYALGTAPFAHLRELQLIAVTCDAPKLLGTCRGYDNGGRIDRLQPILTTTVYQAKTGAKVAAATFEGFKATCPNVWPRSTIEGAAPHDKVSAFLKQFAP